MSCTASVDKPVSACHEISVPSDFNTSPSAPNANKAGLPEASPYIIFPLAIPASCAIPTALSAISSVTPAVSEPEFATVILEFPASATVAT